MAQNPLQGLYRYLKNTVLSATVLILASSAPVAATHESASCSSSTPSSLQPLFELLHTLGILAFAFGAGLGVLGLSVAGLMIAGPFGEDMVRKGKSVVKNTILGVIILLSARMVVDFLINQLAPSFC